MAAPNKTSQVLFVASVTIVAAWLRFSAIDFGLPDQLRPDEDAIVFQALGTPERVETFSGAYPAAQVYLVRAVYYVDAALRGAGRDLAGAYAGVNQQRAFVIARITTAVMGTATVPIIYIAALALSGPLAAMASSGLL